MPQLRVRIYVRSSDALERGSSRAGEEDLAVTDAWAASLSPQQRSELARYVYPAGEENRRCTYTSEWPRLGVTAPTLEAVTEALDGPARKRAAEALEKAARRETLRQTLTAPDRALHRRPSHWPGSRWECQIAGSSTWGLDLETEYDAARAEARRRNDAELADALDRLEPAQLLDGLPDEWRGCLSEAREAARRIRPELAAAADELARRRKAEREALEARQREAIRQAEITLVSDHGTEDQRERLAAGVLPDQELRRLAHEILYAPLAELPRYQRLEARELACDGDHSPRPKGAAADYEGPYTAEQWAGLRAIRAAAAAIPDAEVTVRRHVLRCVEDECEAATVARLSARVTITWAGRELTREYALGEDGASR